MNDRTKRWLLWSTTAVGCCGSASVLLIAAALPIRPPALHGPVLATNRPTVVQPNAAERVIALSDLQAVWDKQLRRSVPPPVTPVPKPLVAEKSADLPTPKTRFEAKLIGTLVDSDPRFAHAWIKHQGKLRMVSVGDVLKELPGSPTVERIAHREVRVSLKDRSKITITAEDSPFLANLTTSVGD